MLNSYAWARYLTEPEWLRFLAGDLEIASRTSPPMPPTDFQISYIGRSGISALEEGALFLSYARSVTPTLTPQSRVLDFGCGWGRLYRVLMREEFSLLLGIDSEPSVLQMCRDALPTGEFRQIGTAPPYPLEAGEFDFSYAFSVFSHLAEHLAQKVFAELGRLLKLGGHLAITLLPIEDFDRLASAQKMARDGAAARDEFMYIPAGGGYESMQPENYGWAYISEPCLSRILRDLPLQLVERVSVPNLGQEVAIIKKTRDT